MFRAIYILFTLFRFGLDQAFFRKYAPSSLFIGALNREQLSKNTLKFCLTLGPIFIKLGQIASTRPDIFPKSLIDSLEKLQDKVPPLSHDTIQQILDAHFPDTFINISPHPLGSGSIAQVHSATCREHGEVVVKVLRPHIKSDIKRDLRAFTFITWLIRILSSRFRHLQFQQFISEFAFTLDREINLKNEAANYITMKMNFEDDDTLYIPRIYEKYTQTNILVMERIHGVKISKLPDDPNINRQYLAKNGVQIFFTQVLRDRFFHADMHPGNILIDLENPNKPRYMAIDFGIIGTLSKEDTYYLGANLRAFFARDYYEIARLHLESNWVCGSVRIEQFEQAIRCVCEPIYAKPVGEISFADVLGQLIKVAQDFKLIPQPQLLLLQKTLLNVEGIGRRLYPELNLWEVALPVVNQYSQSTPLPDILSKGRELIPVIQRQISKSFYPVPAVQQSAQTNWFFVATCSLVSNALLLLLIWKT